MTNEIEKLALENQEVFAHAGDQHEETYAYLEEYMYYAREQRERESHPDYGSGASVPIVGLFESLGLKKSKKVPAAIDGREPAVINSSESPSDIDEKRQPAANGVINDSSSADASISYNTELRAANSMLRNASWVSVFYLITTDILGPSSAPYAISQLGFVPGALLYVLFGGCAGYTGYILWQIFLQMDSEKHPLVNYGEVVGRLFGPKIRTGVDILQALQLLCNVAVIILGNGQGLSQVAKDKACFSVLVLVWALAGMLVGQIRSLQKFGFLANMAIWMNLFVCFATMGIVAHSTPNYSAAAKQGIAIGPIITKAVAPAGFSNQLQAVMNIVYAYGGAMMFIEFMAEMRRPMDFWKGMVLAESVIFVVYLLYGLFVYAYQGQFVINPANQGINPYGWQTALNVIGLVSALIAAGLYGNVGIKVCYKIFVKKLLKGPELNTTKGRYVWVVMVLVYWAVAYVIASAIPQFSALTSLVGAVCILQFTYTFPAFIAIGWRAQVDAMKADGPYDPINNQVNRIDTWKDWSRWKRGLSISWIKNTLNFIFFLASLATAILGIYASAVNLKDAFSSHVTTSFGCSAPV